MSIVRNNKTNSFSVNTYIPLTIESEGLQLPMSSTSVSMIGVIYFDTDENILKYHNGTVWVSLNDTSSISSKVDRGDPSQLAANPTGDKFLRNVNGNMSWVSPEDDGYLRLNASGPVTINNAITFTGHNRFVNGVSCGGNRVMGIVAAGDSDAVPKSFVDATVTQKVSEIEAYFVPLFNALKKRYTDILTYYANNPGTPPVPPPPPPTPPPTTGSVTMGFTSGVWESHVYANTYGKYGYFFNWEQQGGLTNNHIPLIGSVSEFSYTSGQISGGNQAVYLKIDPATALNLGVTRQVYVRHSNGIAYTFVFGPGVTVAKTPDHWNGTQGYYFTTSGSLYFESKIL